MNLALVVTRCPIHGVPLTFDDVDTDPLLCQFQCETCPLESSTDDCHMHVGKSSAADGETEWPTVRAGRSEQRRSGPLAVGSIGRWSRRPISILSDMKRRFGRRSKNASAMTAAVEELGEPGGIETVTTTERLDELLADIERAWTISDDAARSVFASFRMELAVGAGLDPWSEAYRTEQFDLYGKISSRDGYSTQNEVSGFPINAVRPFPYHTASPNTVGDQLIAIGFLIKAMNLAASSSVLEFGPGWGNTTINLARMGYDVTALDIDPDFVDLINQRAKQCGIELDARVGEFLDVEQITETFDAVLFYECFHHCSDHQKLLKDLHRVVNPGGKVVLASEPIFEGFGQPWGLRLDGESLWAIRQNGWLELGFSESYFIETCMRSGWAVTKFSDDISPLTNVFCLTDSRSEFAVGPALLPPADSTGWAEPDSEPTHRYTAGNSRLVCANGLACAEVQLDVANASANPLPFAVRYGESVVDGVLDPNERRVITMPYRSDAGEIWIESDVWCPATVIEGSLDARTLGLAVFSLSYA